MKFSSQICKRGFLALACLVVSSFGGLEAYDKPNIIVVYTDDQGYGDVRYLNPNAKFETPNVDRLAREGITFTNGHSSDAVCTPSRYSLLTGRYSWRTHLKRSVFIAEMPGLIESGRMTLASLLRDNGYDTAMVGKWHLGMEFPGTFGDRDWSKPVTDMPLDKGFDYFWGIPASLNYGVLAWFDGRYAKVPPTVYTAKKPNQRHPDYRIMPPYADSPETTPTPLNTEVLEVAPDFVDNECLTRFTDKAIEWMTGKVDSAKNGNPFFLYLPLTSPHYPVSPLPQFHGQGEAGGYGEFVIETDYHIGRILDFLNESGLDKTTMIVFTSDNGPEDSWRSRIQNFDHDSRGGLRGGKRDIYEGGHRVPFIVRWPQGIENPGRRSNALIGQNDLLATFASIVQVELPSDAGEDSQSFAQVLFDPESKYVRDPLVHHSFDGQFAITQANMKLILPHKDLPAELYDLSKDPSEETSVLEKYSEIGAALQQEITEIVVEGRSTPGEKQSNDTGYWDSLKWMTAEEYQSRTSE